MCSALAAIFTVQCYSGGFSIHAVGDSVVDIQLMVLGDTYEFACSCGACVQTEISIIIVSPMFLVHLNAETTH